MLPPPSSRPAFAGGAGGEAAAPERSLAMAWLTAVAWPRGAGPLDAGGRAREREAIYISRHISTLSINLIHKISSIISDIYINHNPVLK